MDAVETDLVFMGLYGMMVPEEWGGSGADYVSFALAIEEIAAGALVEHVAKDHLARLRQPTGGRHAPDLAEAAFRAALALQPNLELDTVRTSPRVLEAFNRAKQP